MNSQTASRVLIGRFSALALVGSAVLATTLTVRAQSPVGAALCPIITKLLPEVRTYKPEGARAQLVMAVAEKFDYDAVKLRQVRAEADAGTTASCPKEREAILGIMKTKTLAEALS